MGEAKRRGSQEQRQKAAVTRNAFLLGKEVQSSKYGRGVIHAVRGGRVEARFAHERRTVCVTYPVQTFALANQTHKPEGALPPAGKE